MISLPGMSTVKMLVFVLAVFYSIFHPYIPVIIWWFSNWWEQSVICDSYALIQRGIFGFLTLTLISTLCRILTPRGFLFMVPTILHSPFVCFLPHFPSLASEMSFVIYLILDHYTDSFFLTYQLYSVFLYHLQGPLELSSWPLFLLYFPLVQSSWQQFIYLFIYYLWLCWVSVSARGPPPVAASGGHSSSQCAGLSLSRPLVAEHRLQMRRLSNCGSRAQLLRGMWDPLRPGP